jgi:hypothetical protein
MHPAMRIGIGTPASQAERGRERTEVFNAVQAKSYDLTVFKIK